MNKNIISEFERLSSFIQDEIDKLILEKRIGRKILNYKLFNLAISNKTGFSSFFISIIFSIC
jgi:hypothetical protein